MTKVIGMLVALAMFCAMPAIAFAGGGEQDAEIDSGAEVVGGGNGEGDEDGDNGDGDGSGGDAQGGDGNAGNQACLIQQNAGRDANAECNQEQNFGDTFVDNDGDGVDDDDEDVEGDSDESDVSVSHGGGGVGGGEVQSVTLARTGFDAWVLALLGGVSLAGGLGLLAAQRRGRLSA